MKKNFFVAALVGLASVFSVSAEVLTPYVEQFENPTERPKGWLRGGASSYSQGTFTVKTEGGHSGGYITVNQYSNYYSSYYNNYNYNDLLITPAVEGEVSIWVRKNGTDPTLTFFRIPDITNIPSYASDFVRVGETPLNLVEGLTIDDWTQVTVQDVPEGTYLGIRANNLDLDEFTATSANVVYRPSLLVSVSNECGGTTLTAGADKNVTFKFAVSVENNGDVDFPAGDPGMVVTLFNRTADNAVFGTGNITEAISFGQTVTKHFEFTGEPVVAPNTSSNNYIVSIQIGEGDDNKVETSLGWFTVIPYVPAPKLMFFETNSANQSSYNDVNITDVIAIGAGAAGTSRTLCLWNQGTAPMTVTAINLPEGFTTDAQPFTLDANEKTNITISLAGDPGFKSGTMTFVEASLGDVTYELAGLVTAEGDYAEDFEGELTPEGMVIGKSWGIKDVPETLKPLAGEKYIECSSSYTDRFITPLLSFEEGGKLYFMATKSDNTGAKLNIYTSSDRVNWTLAKEIRPSDSTEADSRFNVDKPTGSGYGTYEFKIFSIDMPAGNSYVAFEAGGARVDNIHGGKLVEVAHDLYVVSAGLPDAASVNTRYITNITLRNLLSKAENDYAVVLEVNGEEVARAAETPELTQGAEATYDLRFTPHAEGTFNGEFIFISGSDRVALSSFEFTVGEEKAEAVYQVGDAKIQGTDPLNTIQCAQGQIIYRADQLGMDTGVKITGFSFNGYNTDYLKKNVKVWIENTTDEGYDPDNIVAADKENMTLVYDGEYEFPIVGDASSKTYEPVFVIPFTTPFTYEGGSIRIMIDQRDLTEGAENHNVFITIDNSVYDYWNDIYDNRVITNKKEFAEDLDDEPSWNIYKAGYPVTYFNVAKDVVVAKGTVTDDFGAPIENAWVKFTSDDILYQAYTTAEGQYSMNIINVNLPYELTAEADGFTTYTKPDVTFSSEQPEAINDILLLYADRTAELSGHVYNSLDNNAPLAGVEITLTSGDTTASAVTDDFGNYSVIVPELNATYDIDLKIAGENVGQLTGYTFASKAETKDFNVAHSAIAGISAEAETVVTVNGHDVTVIAPAGSPLEIYNMTGVKVASAVSEGAAVTFGPLASGIYVAAGHKIVIR